MHHASVSYQLAFHNPSYLEFLLRTYYYWELSCFTQHASGSTMMERTGRGWTSHFNGCERHIHSDIPRSFTQETDRQHFQASQLALKTAFAKQECFCCPESVLAESVSSAQSIRATWKTKQVADVTHTGGCTPSSLFGMNEYSAGAGIHSLSRG